jgi:DNA repair exonuclease SbcCD nuclease subunit
MEENGLDTIVQLGDFFDNRKTINIKLFNDILDKFCKVVDEKGFKFYSLIGNHDIYYSSTLEVNLVNIIERIYPNSFKFFDEVSTVKLGSYTYKFFPWLIDKKIEEKDLEGADVIFGHFEIKDFEMVKGHVNQTSDLDSKFFKKAKKLKRVVSGHYHVQSSDGFIMYVGTPYQLNWGDYRTRRGFFVFEGHDYEFIQNECSSNFVKLKYNDKKEKRLTLSGISENDYVFDDISELPDISGDIVKFFVNEAEDKEYESVAFDLHQSGIRFEMINNVEISNLIGAKFKSDVENVGGAELLIQTVKERKPHLVELLDAIFTEIEVVNEN